MFNVHRMDGAVASQVSQATSVMNVLLITTILDRLVARRTLRDNVSLSSICFTLIVDVAHVMNQVRFNHSNAIRKRANAIAKHLSRDRIVTSKPRSESSIAFEMND